MNSKTIDALCINYSIAASLERAFFELLDDLTDL